MIFTTFPDYFRFIRFVVVHISFARVERTAIVSYNIVFVFNEVLGRRDVGQLSVNYLSNFFTRYMRSVLFRSMRYHFENRLSFTARFRRVIMSYDSFSRRLPPVPWVYFCLQVIPFETRYRSGRSPTLRCKIFHFANFSVFRFLELDNRCMRKNHTFRAFTVFAIFIGQRHANVSTYGSNVSYDRLASMLFGKFSTSPMGRFLARRRVLCTCETRSTVRSIVV